LEGGEEKKKRKKREEGKWSRVKPYRNKLSYISTRCLAVQEKGRKRKGEGGKRKKRGEKEGGARREFRGTSFTFLFPQVTVYIVRGGGAEGGGGKKGEGKMKKTRLRPRSLQYFY